MTMGLGLKHPHSPNDPFLAKLAAAASTEMGKAQLAGARRDSDAPPLLDILDNPVMMAAPAQVRRVDFSGFFLVLIRQAKYQRFWIIACCETISFLFVYLFMYVCIYFFCPLCFVSVFFFCE